MGSIELTYYDTDKKMKLVFVSALALCAALVHAAPSPQVRGCKKNPLKDGCPCTIEAFEGCPNYVAPETEAPTTKATTPTTEMSTEAPTTKATTTKEVSTEAPVETTEKVVDTTEEVVESSEAPVVTTEMEASTEKEGHGTTAMPDHMSTANPKDHGKGDHGKPDGHHGKPDGDHGKPDGDHGMNHDHKPENMHGWATEDILKVLGKLGEMRRDTEDDAIAGNYFVGGDFVVNNGLINNNVAAVAGVHAATL